VRNTEARRAAQVEKLEQRLVLSPGRVRGVATVENQPTPADTDGDRLAWLNDFPGVTVIARGQVTRATPYRHPHVGGIFTLCRMSVLEVFKGRPDGEVEFNIRGGALDGVAESDSSMPTCRVGEEVVVHLMGTAPGLTLVGGAENYLVTLDAQGAENWRGRIVESFIRELSRTGGRP
jgi:hypothetical protein